MKKGIVIYWESAIENIDFDFDSINSIENVKSSTEYSHSNETYHYNITPKIVSKSKSLTIVEIQYKSANNRHLSEKDTLWGTSTITIDAEKNSGRAVWKDDNDSYHDGQCDWDRFGGPLRTKGRKRETTTRLQREQAKFRQKILKFDNACIISRENNEVVLEAAHIIPVSEKGADVPENGIILRSDLHKLYDAGAFAISANGKLYIDPTYDLSDAYISLLDTHISSNTLSRIKRALKLKEEL